MHLKLGKEKLPSIAKALGIKELNDEILKYDVELQLEAGVLDIKTLHQLLEEGSDHLKEFYLLLNLPYSPKLWLLSSFNNLTDQEQAAVYARDVGARDPDWLASLK